MRRQHVVRLQFRLPSTSSDASGIEGKNGGITGHVAASFVLELRNLQPHLRRL